MWDIISNQVNIKDLIESIVLFIIAIAQIWKGLSGYFKGKIKSENDKEVKKIIGHQITTNYKIIELITECRLYYSANRVTLSQFHNGDFFMNRNSILKFSITHETTDNSTRSIVKDFQNVLVSTYHNLIELLYKDKKAFFPDIQSLESSIHRDEFNSRGVLSQFIVAVTSTKGDIIGFVIMDFTNNKVNKIDEKKLFDFGNRISVALNKLDEN